MSNCLDAALAYRERGFSVIPVKKDKRPLLPWTRFQTEKATPEEINSWWAKWPTANVAIVTGQVSQLVVVDIDSAIGLEAYKAQFGEVHGTCRQTTGKPGAMHLLFQCPNGCKLGNGSRGLPDVDVRGQGGYIVAAPSVHQSGRQYTWLVDPLESPNDLLPLPKDVQDWFWPSAKESPADKKERLDIQTLLLGVQQGQRNDICAKLAGYYLRITKGDIGQAKAILSAWNDRNTPPLDWKEVERTVESIGKRHQQEEIKEEGESGSLFSKIEKLIYPDGEFRYRVWVDGFSGYLDMDSLDFTSRVRFKTKFFELTDISPKLPKGDKWDDWLTSTMKTAVHVQVEEDESPLGLIETILSEATRPERRCTDMALIKTHVVVEESMGNLWIYFHLSYVSDALLAYGQKVSPRQIGQYLRRLGCRKTRRHIVGQLVHVWEKIPHGSKKRYADVPS